ncbi:uncharacterized protein LOC128558101 [Mercenaria mercenaria]|uniref:uncharacterized protein LOC128558101 n=1 Tax=Mercenaria mercenaria TaxID=6596 RepID=UPI00234F699F|nr:uncharacterized protein LOC128558101 [Mercenaria mercenaria]
MGNNISRRLVGSRSLEEDVPMPMPAGVIRKPRPYDEIYIPESEGFVMPMPEGVRRRRHPYDEVDIPGNEATSIPDELQYDPRTRELYEKAIKEGREEDSTLRVMVIGCFGQGKTSLTRRLTGQTLDRIETTDGIEVDTCTVHEDSKWKRGSKDYHESDYLKRIAVIANNTQTFTETALPKEDHLRSESKQTAYPEELSKPQAISEIEDNKEITDARSKTENFQVFKSELLKRRSLKQKTDDKCYKLNIWDFGGQFVYYATHQYFIQEMPFIFWSST